MNYTIRKRLAILIFATLIGFIVNYVSDHFMRPSDINLLRNFGVAFGLALGLAFGDKLFFKGKK